MRYTLLLTLMVAATAAAQQAPKPAPPPAGQAKPAAPQAPPAGQKPAAPQAPPAGQKPATPQAPPAAPRPAPSAAAVAARTAMLLTVTNPGGRTLPGVQVNIVGPVTREGTTDNSGSIRFTGLRAGTYRARFTGETVVAFEKEVVVRAGQTADVDATLTPAEERPAPPAPPPPPPPPPQPEPAPVGPVGKPLASSLIDLVERERLGNQKRLETLVACSGNTRSTLLQLAQDQPQRLYAGAESLLYVIAGEASITMGGRDSSLAPGGFASVPRGQAYSIKRRGNKTFVALSVLAGEPCEQAQ